MNNPVLIKLVIAIGAILGVAYWFSYNPGVDTLSVTETNEKLLSADSPVSSSDQNLKQPTMQNRDISAQNTFANTKSDVGSYALYQFEDHGSAAYLNAKDKVPELAMELEVI